jgi:GDPmannose 4,6-dehydratase
MWLMMQKNEPDDFVVATGKAHSVGEFAKLAFEEADLDWNKYVKVDPKFIRPAEVNLLLGDASKARRVLGWEPEVTFEELVRMMVREDLKRYEDKRKMAK